MKNEKDIIEEFKQYEQMALQITPPAYIDIPPTRKMRPGAKWVHRDSDGQYKKKKSE